jgi:radical SAM superfamily enzyme YgiQ (UPF0313 family)
MRILLISANTETLYMVPLPLGLNLVAVALRNAGHYVEILDLMGKRDDPAAIREALQRVQPDVIGISVRNIDNQNMAEPRFLLEPVRNIVSCCRSCSAAPIVVGGAGFSIFPEATLAYLGADMGIRGEGEMAFPHLLRVLERGEDPSTIPGLCLPGHSVCCGSAERAPLADLPLPDPLLWSIPGCLNQEVWIPFQTRRGCPMGCSYCSTATLEGRIIRRHPPEEVINSLDRHVACGFRQFYFVDNVFNLPPDYARQLCAALIEADLGISWRCILYPGFINEQLVRSMARAGCVEVSLGFESADPQILTAMNKKFTPDEVRRTALMLASHGIRRNGFLLLGGPGETRESVMESLAFADSLNLDTLKLTRGIRIYPHTRVAGIARQEGVIAAEDNLLFPRFYLSRGVEGWLEDTVREWMMEHPNCLE